MVKYKFHRSIRKIKTTNFAGLLVFKRLTDQLGLQESLEGRQFKKLHGHSMKVIFFALIIKALMGNPSLDDFEDKVNGDRFIRKVANFTKKLGKTVLGRNMKRLKPAFLHQNYYLLVNKLIDRRIVTLDRIAIDSTFIEVFGKAYQKATYGWGKTKAALGYRLSVAFDIDSKLPIAYIITFGHKHDSRFLVPLTEIIKSKYGIIPTSVVIDRGYYGEEFFTYLTDNGIALVIPLKKFSHVIKTFQCLNSKEFQLVKDLSLHYKDDYLRVGKSGQLRVVWLVCTKIEKWMPKDLKPGDWWGLLTNRVDNSPVEVIQAYRERWEIEVFFRSTRQRVGLNKLPGRDFRQIQAHIFFTFVGYILLMLVRHLAPLDDKPLRIDLKIIQNKALIVEAVFLEKGRDLKVHFTSRGWLFYHEEEITMF